MRSFRWSGGTRAPQPRPQSAPVRERSGPAPGVRAVSIRPRHPPYGTVSNSGQRALTANTRTLAAYWFTSYLASNPASSVWTSNPAGAVPSAIGKVADAVTAGAQQADGFSTFA